MKFAHVDSRRSDGAYVKFARETVTDTDASPEEYLFQDPDYHDEDQARLDAWRAGDWEMLGIRVIAHILVVRSGTGTMYTITSAGLWGIESDSGEAYFAEVEADERAGVLADLAMFGSVTVEE